MPRIILIETSTALCSTALVEGDKIVSTRISDEPRSHASVTAVFVDEMLRERGLKVSDCDAVCLSMGPGSYTGLRVGSSTAKGLCFGAGIPLLAVSTPEVLACQAIDGGLLPEGCTGIIPMIDARRMEVYAAVFTTAGEQIGEIAPVVVDGSSFAEERAKGPVLFIGDGAGKCESMLSGSGSFVQTNPLASAMLRPAIREFNEKRFKDIAYFEPFYLKQFVATVSAKKLF